MRAVNLFGVPQVDEIIVPAMPYMGNKRKLATKILNSIYNTVGDFGNLYDLFGGGGSMSVAGLLAGHNVYYNELNTGIYNLLKYIKGGGELPRKWISRKEFNKHKHGDDWYSGFIKCCWSFGNNQQGYLFGKDIEELKRQAHEYQLKNGYDWTSEKRNELLSEFKEKEGIKGRFGLEQLERLERLQRLQQLERLERLQQLERLERLQQLERLDLSNKSYDDVIISNRSVIYCDPPYINTAGYQEGKDFDYEKFYSWCLDNENPVFISEYNMPGDFKCIFEVEHRSTLSSTANNKVVEKVYWNGKNLSTGGNNSY